MLVDPIWIDLPLIDSGFPCVTSWKRHKDGSRHFSQTHSWHQTDSALLPWRHHERFLFYIFSSSMKQSSITLFNIPQDHRREFLAHTDPAAPFLVFLFVARSFSLLHAPLISFAPHSGLTCSPVLSPAHSFFFFKATALPRPFFILAHLYPASLPRYDSPGSDSWTSGSKADKAIGTIIKYNAKPTSSKIHQGKHFFFCSTAWWNWRLCFLLTITRQAVNGAHSHSGQHQHLEVNKHFMWI